MTRAGAGDADKPSANAPNGKEIPPLGSEVDERTPLDVTPPKRNDGAPAARSYSVEIRAGSCGWIATNHNAGTVAEGIRYAKALAKAHGRCRLVGPAGQVVYDTEHEGGAQ